MGRRVKVLNGDQTAYVGEGEHVANVSVYIFVKRDEMHIETVGNPEEMPTEETVRMMRSKDMVMEHVPANPKMLLDDGRIIYGCQCWWTYV